MHRVDPDIGINFYGGLRQLVDSLALIEQERYRFSDGPIGPRPCLRINVSYVAAMDHRSEQEIREVMYYEQVKNFVSLSWAKDACDILWKILSFANKSIDEESLGAILSISLRVMMGPHHVAYGYEYGPDPGEDGEEASDN